MNFLSLWPVCALAAALAASAGLAQQGRPPASPPPAPPKPAASAHRWRVQYFYDESKSTLAIQDLKFVSPARGVAVGTILEGHHQKHVALVTSDGGGNWQTIPLHDAPLSLEFLNEGLGWMVGRSDLWKTTEAGKNWEKVRGFPSDMLVVHFLNEKDGLAAGARKRVFTTSDGGARWTAVAAAAEPPGEAKYSVYNWISFANPQLGVVAGWNQPPRRFGGEQFPEWMDPESTMERRETPHLGYTLVTMDGGKTWKSSSSSMFGRVARVRFSAQGKGLGLIEYGNSFRYPSEVYTIPLTSGQNRTVYRDRKFAVTDVWLTADGTAYLAGIEEPGEIRGVVPGKVQVLESQGGSFDTWTPMPVDYRAVANRVVITAVDGQNIWLATDNGMILKMTQ